MTENTASVLSGAVAMASLVAALFFVKFWRRTRDQFFLFFAAAFAINSATRFLLAIVRVSNEAEPVSYLPRLLTFALILIAILNKNAPRNE